MGEIDLQQLVGEIAKRDSPRTEADVQAGVRDLLLRGGLNLEGHHVALESPAEGQRRIDVEVGFTVIEVKPDSRMCLEWACD